MIQAMLMALLLAAQAPAQPPITLSPAALAEGMQQLVGSRYEGGITITQIYTEGRTLVVVVDGPAALHEMSAERASGFVLNGFCRGSPVEYFVDGNAMRVDTTVAGRAKRMGPTVTRCPDSEG